MSDTTDHVLVFEMGPRDGLQNEPRPIATADKVRLVDLLSLCGFEKIETTSFVSPKWVPQMADAAQVMAGITRRQGTRYTALTPNVRGYEAACQANVDEVAIFGAASESFSKANINCSIADSLQRFQPVVNRARADGVPVRGYVSCAVVCPYEGPIAPDDVVRISEAFLRMGCYEISLGDTVGKARPEATDAMLRAVCNAVPARRLAGHFHDTDGRALHNITVSLDHGLRVFDAAIGGLGGCPYAPGAKGNVASEAVVAHVTGLGYATGIDRGRLDEAAALAADLRQ